MNNATNFLGDITDTGKVVVVCNDWQVDYASPEGVGATVLGWDVSHVDDIVAQQVEFVDEIRAINEILRVKGRTQIQIVWVRGEEAEETMLSNQPFDPAGFLPLAVRGTPGHEFYGVQPDLDSPNEHHFLKFAPSVLTAPAVGQVSAFEQFLQGRGATNLVWNGTLTSRCILTGMTDAFGRGYRNIATPDLITMPLNSGEDARHMDIEDAQARWRMEYFFAEMRQSAEVAAYLRQLAEAA